MLRPRWAGAAGVGVLERGPGSKQRPRLYRRATSVPDSCAGFIPIGQGRHLSGEGGIRNDQDDCDRASQGTDHEGGNHKKKFFLVCTPSGSVEDVPWEDVPAAGDGVTTHVPERSPGRIGPGDGNCHLVFNHSYATQCQKSSPVCSAAAGTAVDRRQSYVTVHV